MIVRSVRQRRQLGVGIVMALLAVLPALFVIPGPAAAGQQSTGGYSCPGSVGGRRLDGPTNVGVPGEWAGGDAAAGYLIGCSYPDPAGQWGFEVSWAPVDSPATTSWGCGSPPPHPGSWVSPDHWAYSGANIDAPPAPLAAATQQALADVVAMAKLCAAAPTSTAPTPAPAPTTPTTAPPLPTSPDASPSTSAPLSAGPLPSAPAASTPLATSAVPPVGTPQPLCAAAATYYGSTTLAAAGVTDPNRSGLLTNYDTTISGFRAVIASYNAAHPDAPAGAPTSSKGVTLGAINWLWELGGLSSKIPGISKLYGNTPTEAYVTGTEPRLSQRISTSDHPLTPAEVFSLALDLNGGNVTNALLAAHNTLRALGRNDDVDQALIGVGAAGPTLYGQHLAQLRTGAEQGGPWYHLFGTAYFELVSAASGNGAGAAAQAAALGDDTSAPAMSQVGTAAGQLTAQLPEPSFLSGLANWAEQKIRARHGSPPDPEKYCLNIWGAQLGAALAQQLPGPTSASPTPEQAAYDAYNGVLGGPVIDIIQSPFSVQWSTASGTTTIDQKSGTVNFGTPLLVFPLYEGGTWGMAWIPAPHASGTITFTATTGGAELHFLQVDATSGKAYFYRARAAAAGDQMRLSTGPEPTGQALIMADGSAVRPQVSTLGLSATGRGGSSTTAEAAAAAGVAVIGALVLFIVRRRRRGLAAPIDAVS